MTFNSPHEQHQQLHFILQYGDKNTGHFRNNILFQTEKCVSGTCLESGISYLSFFAALSVYRIIFCKISAVICVSSFDFLQVDVR